MYNFLKGVNRYNTMTAMENESSDGNVSPKKKSIRKGKTALARVLLLDGSYLDVQIDVNIYTMNEFTIFLIKNIFMYLLSQQLYSYFTYIMFIILFTCVYIMFVYCREKLKVRSY